MTELSGVRTVVSDAPQSDESGRPAVRQGSGVWTVAVLSLVALLAAIDRQAFSVLLVPIQNDLQVSDAAMGILSGSAFAIVYAVIAFPIARLVDRANRRNLLAIAVVVWSAATAVCGFAGKFLQILFARLVVGAAESAQGPATMSMIGDLFPLHRRGTAIAFITVGSALGFALGSALAGALADRYSWHVALMVVGAPGLILGAVLFLSVREPLRGVHDGLAHAPRAQETTIQCLRRCARIRTLYPFVIGWVCLQASFSGWLIWVPAFLMRVHHLSSTKMGAVFGAIIACATFSAMIAGPLSDFLARRGARWRLYYCCTAAVLSAPILAASTLVPTLPAAVVCLVAYTLVSGGLTTVGAATYVSFAPPTMRGFMTALMNLSAALLGAGAAPVFFGAMNDLLKQTYADQSLRYTLLLAPLLLTIAGVCFLIASRTADEDSASVSPRAVTS